MPAVATRTVLDFLGEKRGFDWIRLDAALLPTPVAAPTDADLQAEYDAHPERYTRPETRRIVYASVTPEALAATITIPDDNLRAAYDAAIDTYRTPERRVADRIAFGTAEEAAAARARLDAGEIDFDALAAERGLTSADIDQGFVTADKLSGPARDAFFAAAGPGIVGPVDTPLGPALYRINAILAATTTPFDEAKAGIAHDRALVEAERRIHEDTAAIDDLLAGGATVEEVADETVLEPGTLALDAATTGGLADDPAFRSAAEGAEVGIDTDPIELADGEIATLRVDAIDPPALLPLAEIRDRVSADWTAAQTAAALTTLADGYVAEIGSGLTLAALGERLGRAATIVAPLTRGDSAEGVPPALIADVFAAEPDGTLRPRRRRHGPAGACHAAAAVRSGRRGQRPGRRPARPAARPAGQRRHACALHRRAARRGRRVDQPGADRHDARPLPLMDLYPAFDDFAARFDAGASQVVWTRLVADLDTPVSPMLKLTEARKDSFLLESVTGGEVRGRYSIMGMKPDLIWECRGTAARINRSARFDPDAWTEARTDGGDGDPLASLRALIAESRIDLPPALPPMAAGLFGYLGYDMIRLVERLPDVNPDPIGVPDALIIRPSVVLVVDGVKGEVTVVSPAWAGSGLSARAAYAQAAERVMDAVRDLDRTPSAAARRRPPATPSRFPTPRAPRTTRSSRRRRSYIRAGDIFQVVPSSAGRMPFELPPFALYRALRRTNPSPFMFYFNFAGFQVIGASPEILVRVEGGTVTVRPLAGTRPRGGDAAEDRGARGGTARRPQGAGRAPDARRPRPQRRRPRGDDRHGRPERAVHHRALQPRDAHHLERRRRARRRPGRARRAARRAAGRHGVRRAESAGDADHRRARDREARRLRRRRRLFRLRGQHGHLHRAPHRVVKDGDAYIQAGGGVVYDSDPDAEYEETVNKAKALRQAARDAALFMGGRGGN